jgi:hypothetical protein
MKKMRITKIILPCFLLLVVSGCYIFKPINLPDNTPKNTGKLPKDSTAVVIIPIDSTTETSTSELKNNRVDPDKIKVNFTKEASETYRIDYVGKVRAVAKTSIATRKTEFFETVGDFLATLPTDNYMRQTGVNDKSLRTVDENRNVLLKKAYIFHIKEEPDQDFHLLIGDLNEKGEKVNILNVEISGLPKNKTTKDYFFLERTRRQLYEKYPEFFTGNKKTFVPKSKFPEITVRGSLFFDSHHSPDQIGSGAAKPKSVWEIHPVTYIEFK